MDHKSLTGAALAALALAACSHHHHHGKASAKDAAPAAAAKGECHGVNECKGKGACGSGENHDCAGQNTCKGLGWISLTKAECDAKGGTFKG
jgi:uncharacterized membrane protein